MLLLKLFIAMIVVVSLPIHVCPQNLSRPGASSKVKNKKPSVCNRSPIIKSFVASSYDLIIPCPRWTSTGDVAERLALDLIVDAMDPDGDELSYEYSVARGKIMGEGSSVTWDLTGVGPGSYEAKVKVGDGRGGVVLESIGISLSIPSHCPIPCANVYVSCPDEIKEGQTITCAAIVSGGEPNLNPTYKWSTSFGAIIKGQGTPTVDVDSTGLAGKDVTVVLDVGGYPPECFGPFSNQIQVRKKN